MTTRDHSGRDGVALAEQMATVRRAVLEVAQREADTLVSDAAADATQIEVDAIAERDAEIEHARAEGVAAAEREGARAAAEAMRVIRARILAAQRAIYDDLCAEVHARVNALRGDPDYSALLDGWAAVAVAQIGAEATVIRDPSPDGGVIATLDGRRVSYTLTALADHEMARLADKVGCLWT